MYDPGIYVSMTATMRAVQKAVSHGYYFYVTGRIDVNSVQSLVQKFDALFHVSAHDKEREYNAKKGRFSAKLILHPNSGRTDLEFWLLRTDGDHPLIRSEKWRDARANPILWPFLYELRQVPVSPKHRERFKRPNGKVAIRSITWTWRFQRDEMDRLKACIRHWVQADDERLPRMIRGLSLAPGFRAVREDVYTTHQYIAQQCVKRDRIVPDFPKRRGILLRKGRSFTTYPLSKVVARVRRGADTWFPPKLKGTDTAVVPEVLLEKPHAEAVRPKDNLRKEEADDSPPE